MCCNKSSPPSPGSPPPLQPPSPPPGPERGCAVSCTPARRAHEVPKIQQMITYKKCPYFNFCRLLNPYFNH